MLIYTKVCHLHLHNHKNLTEPDNVHHDYKHYEIDKRL